MASQIMCSNLKDNVIMIQSFVTVIFSLTWQFLTLSFRYKSPKNYFLSVREALV